MSVILQIQYYSSVLWKITPLYFFRSNILYFGQKKPIKVQTFEAFDCSGQNSSNSCQFWNNKSVPLQTLHHSSLSTYSSENFKLMHFLIWIRGSHQSPYFNTFNCSGGNLPNFSCHFPNHKSVLLQILNHSSVSWKITLLYFFRSSVIYFAHKEPIKVQVFETFQCLGQNSPSSCHFCNNKSFFFFLSNFTSLFRVMTHNFSVRF